MENLSTTLIIKQLYLIIYKGRGKNNNYALNTFYLRLYGVELTILDTTVCVSIVSVLMLEITGTDISIIPYVRTNIQTYRGKRKFGSVQAI